MININSVFYIISYLTKIAKDSIEINNPYFWDHAHQNIENSPLSYNFFYQSWQIQNKCYVIIKLGNLILESQKWNGKQNERISYFIQIQLSGANQYPMLSTLKLTTVTYIGREEEKKLALILSYLIDLPQAAEFIHPVDWEDLELNDYPLVIKNPMNLLKVQDRLKGREYRTLEEVLDHIQLIWDNCKAYNPEGPFYILADKMERAFKKMIRNYLPNIQVVVPKPINSKGQIQGAPTPANNQQLPSIQQNPSLKSIPKTATKAITTASQPIVNLIQEPISVNQPVQNLPQPEQIPQSQKNRFHQRLRQLTQHELGQIVTIVQQNCPEGFKQISDGRCQMWLDNVNLETFRRMNQRIDDLLQGEKGAISGSKKLKQ